MDAVIVIPVIGVTAVAVAIFKKKKKVYKFFVGDRKVADSHLFSLCCVHTLSKKVK